MKVFIGMVLALASTLSVWGILYIKSYYQVAFDGQAYERCLPFWVFGVELNPLDGDIQTGQLVQIIPNYNRGEKIKKGTSVTKIVLGKEGDHILIKDDKLYINGSYFDDLHLILALKAKSKDFDAEYVIPSGKYFVGGTSPGSYDSRYWGLVERNEIKGAVHAIL